MPDPMTLADVAFAVAALVGTGALGLLWRLNDRISVLTDPQLGVVSVLKDLTTQVHALSTRVGALESER